MAENSNISWTDHTFNPWIGCQKVAPECDNCYAEAMNKRWNGGENWGPKAPRRRTSESNWKLPIKWNKNAEQFYSEHGRRQRVFCASLADVFDNAVPDQWRIDLFALIRECDQLDWLLLTKRPQNIKKMLPTFWPEYWEHVWLGVSAGTQKTADINIPILIGTPCAIRFVSAEPLLENVNFTSINSKDGYAMNVLAGHLHRFGAKACDLTSKLDWVIVGGESGPNHRIMKAEWVESMGWHNKTNLESLALIGSEVGEACNETRGKSPTENFGSELADIILRTADLAHENNIDLDQEVKRKMEANFKLQPGHKGRLK